MGLFDFVKDAGASIFGKEKEGEETAGLQTRPIDLRALEAAKRKKALAALLAELALAVEELRIEVDGDTATVYGLVDDQAEREKVVLALGNVAGIARVDDRLETKKAEPESRLHTVVAGDSLSKIAKQYYGNAGKYMAIFEANRPMLKDPDKIYPGQVLRIPAQAS